VTKIRAKSIVIFENKNRFLFTVCHENSTNQVFYIPVGGGVHVGEYSDEAARREVLEEIGQEIENIHLLEVTENIFTYNGIDEHEIVFIYQADFKNKHAYETPLISSLHDSGDEIKLIWSTINDIKSLDIKVYPQTLIKILEEKNKRKEN
jgi:8-oxo-dGTP pyrophosphatase MutT (NUDIX family)